MSNLYDQHGRPLTTTTTRPAKRGYTPGWYRGNEVNRYRSSIPYAVSDSKHTLNKSVRRRLMGYARWLYVNSGMVRGAVNDMARYSVGRGIKPQSLVEGAAGDYEQYFAEWCKVADVSGVFNFYQMQKLASIRMDVDGDLGLLMVNNGFPQLQVIESHSVESKDRELTAHDGVKASKAGRPTAYSLRDGEGFKTVSANDFVLIYDPDRVAQLRGVSALAHATDHVRDQMEILDYEKVGVKMSSAIGIAITTQGGTADDGQSLIETGYTAADTGNVPWDTMQAGMIPRLKIGEDITSFASNRPNATFQGFIEHLTREVSLGMGLPYEFIVDPARQGTASRFILEKAQRRFEERQDTIEKFSNRVYAWVIAAGIKRGDLAHAEGFWRVRWQPPKKITVDNGRDSKANADALKLGTRTLAEDAGERGQDWEELRNQVEREASDLLTRAKRLTIDHDITLDTAIALLSQRQPNPVFNNDEPQITSSDNN